MKSIELIERLRSKSKEALNGGGTERIQKQHRSGKLTARERVDILFDKGPFIEIDRFIVPQK